MRGVRPPSPNDCAFVYAMAYKSAHSVLRAASIRSAHDAGTPHWRLYVRRSPLRGERPARVRGLLPLHALPAALGRRRLHQCPSSARLVLHQPRGGADRRLPPRRRVREGLLLGLRLGAVQPRSRRPRRHRRAHGDLRRRPRRPSLLPPVRRLRGAVGTHSRRRPTAAPRRPTGQIGAPWTSPSFTSTIRPTTAPSRRAASR